MLKAAWFVGLSLTLLVAQLAAAPITVHPENPHYYLFSGKATILITSAEHYGGVVNKDFDYVTYFDALKSYGLNYTRIYPGALFEPMGKFVKGNTLGPKPASLIVPWARSNVPGYLVCGNKFDLDKWDPEYFKRLKDFIIQAGKRGIVVEICFFNSQYSDTWPISPLYYENNVQGVGKCDYLAAQTMKHADLVARMDDYVSKITHEVNEFDNVILEICDEPSLFTPHAEAGPWVAHFVPVIRKAESNLPKKHLLAQQVEGPVDGPIDLSARRDVDIIVTQYLYEAGDQMGGLKALDLKYGLNKPIEENETDYLPIWYEGDLVGDSRVEAWEFIVGGGGSFNQLNGIYTVENPAGKTPDNEKILRALTNLKEFMYSFDFLKMSPDKSVVVSGIPSGAHLRSMSQPGQQYALYLHHGQGGTKSAYKVVPGSSHEEELVLNLPAGTYQADWVDPASGKEVRREAFAHAGGNRTVTTPRHSVDVALRIRRN